MRTPTPVIAALLCCALAACSPAATTTMTPSFPHVYRCKGDVTCSAEQWQKEKEQADLYWEAHETYRNFTAERNRVAQAGGAQEATPRMKELAEGKFLQQIEGQLKTQLDQGRRLSGDITFYGVEAVSPREGALITLGACEDARSVDVLGPDGSSLGLGALAQVKLDFRRRDDGRLVIFAGAGELVQTCS